MLKIRPLRDDDNVDLSVLVVSAFGQPNEWRLIEALRKSGDVAFELVAEEESGLVGYICLSRFRAPEGWMILGPLCVRPARQGIGIGRELVRYGLDQARQRHARAVVVVGDPDYYHRFGFVFEGPAKLLTPYPSRFTGLYPIAPQTAMAQTVLEYPPAFAEV